jgi:hypothetical protein
MKAALLMGTSLCLGGCGLWNPANSLDFEPSRVPVGELVVGTWLPAGLDEFRFEQQDQQRLLELGINQIEWLQRAVRDSVTAEEMAMAFCSGAGLRMPIYYEPRGYSPYDKLHNWATRAKAGASFADSVRARVLGLLGRWGHEPGFQGYLIGHEDYDREYYPALRDLVQVLRQEDPEHPALTVGAIDSYPGVERFLDAFFAEGGAPNVFQHEYYAFRAEVPGEGRKLQRRLDELVQSYEKVARHLQGRHGRWHAIVQVHSEARYGLGESGPYYRKPGPAEIGVQVGLALSRGASGIVYFLYSSGVEEARDGQGQMVQTRLYEGLVDREGEPTASYAAVQELNAQLQALSPALAGLYFHGGFSAERVMDNSLLRRAEGELEFGLFGDGARETHLLVVNRSTTRARWVELEVSGEDAVDAASGEVLKMADGRLRVALEAGGFRLLNIR